MTAADAEEAAFPLVSSRVEVIGSAALRFHKGIQSVLKSQNLTSLS